MQGSIDTIREMYVDALHDQELPAKQCISLNWQCFRNVEIELRRKMKVKRLE